MNKQWPFCLLGTVKWGDDRMSIIKDLHSISTDIRLSFTDKVYRLLEIGTEVLGLETGIVSHVVGDTYQVIQAVSPSSNISSGAEFPLSDTYCADTVNNNGIVAYHNVDFSPGNTHPCYSRYDLKAYLATPIHVDGTLYGTLNFSSTHSRPTSFTSLDFDYLLLLADWIGGEVGRKRALNEIIEQRNSLAEQHTLLNQITELAGVGTWELDWETGALSWSDSLKRMLHLSEDRVVTSRTVMNFFSSNKAKAYYQSKFTEIAKTGKDWTYEFEAVTEIGEKLWLESRTHPVMENGQCIKMIGATRDISERVYTTQTLVHKTELAEQALKARSEFLANMSHEIRTPIHGVQGMLEALSSTSLSSKQKHYTHVAMRSADSLLNIVNDILDFSKIDAGHMMYEQSPLCIKEIIEQQVPMFQKLADKKGLALTVETSALAEKLFIGDSLRINQILINLLNNAVKFTNKGVIKLSTRCESYGVGRYKVKLIVSDTGIGISKAQQEVIFAPFLQAEESTQRRFGGTGLGLAIVSKIVGHYEGNIDVSSTLGKGTKFVITLIFDSANVGALVDDKVNKALIPDLGRDALGESRILVVEDNEINQIVIKEQLKEIGVHVDLAENGALGVEKVQQALNKKMPYDLILMDCHMPVKDGLTATREIRQLGGGSLIPIIALTANALAGEKERCLAAGMNDFISKPVGVSRLRDCINFHLAFSHQKLTNSA